MSQPIIIGLPYRVPKPFVEDENRLIDRLMEHQLVDIYYQPIVDLRSRSVFAYEALGRPCDGYFRTPEELIEAANRGGRMGELGRHLRELSIQDCSRWPLFLNLDPREFTAPFLIRPDDPIVLHDQPVYLEISETVPTEFSDECFGVLAELRRKGVLLAIDDFGAGSSSLRYIVELQPDIIKLDRELVMGCVPGSREFELLRTVTGLCHQMEAKVIAEGVETVQELKAVIAAGVDYGQGFLLSLPNRPPPPFFWPPEVSLQVEDFVAEYIPTEKPRPETPPKPVRNDSQKTAADTDAQATIRHLEDELSEVRQELAESLEERSVLAERLKRFSHLAERAESNAKRQSSSGGTATAKAPAAQDEDTVEFLRQLEVKVGDDTDGAD